MSFRTLPVLPDAHGHFGKYGGMFVPETLMAALTELSERMTRGVLQANGSVAPEPMMDARHVADAVRHIAALPLGANVLNMTVMASAMPFVGRG